MKHYILSLSITFISLINFSACSEGEEMNIPEPTDWIQQSSGTTKTLHDVSFPDSNNGWAVGDNGIILHTSNGGKNWIEQRSYEYDWYYGVCFTDSNHGIVVGSNGFIHRTTTGGRIWALSQVSGITYGLFDVFFVNSDFGWIVGNYTIYKTTNGGNYWSGGAGSSEYFNAVYFTDVNHGWLVSSNGIFRYRESEGWVSCYPIGQSDICFVDTLNGWAVGGSIFRTTDGGNTWTEQIKAEWGLNAVAFTDLFNGTAVGHVGTILKTTNGGDTWISQNSGSTASFFGISFPDAKNGWIVGSSGKIYRTKN